MVESFRNHIDFLVYYSKAKLEAESFRHHAGYLWWVLDPLIGLAVYYFLFKVILHRGGDDYIPFLFIGLIGWKWWSDSVSKSSGSLLSNLNLMKKIRIDKHVFPMVEIFYHTWKFLVIFTFVIIVYAFFGYGVTSFHLLLPIVLLSQFVLIVGVSFFLSSIIPFLPDLQFLVTYSMRLLFYPSGVIFSLAMVPDEYHWVIKVNPMAGMLESYRNIMMHGLAPNYSAMGYSLVLGLVLGTIGLMIMKKNDQEYPKLT